MAINIWTQDQSPNLQLAGAQSLAGGIAGFGQSIGAALERYGEEKKKREEELKRVLASDKAMMGFVGALPEETAAEMGLPSKLDLSAMKAGEPTAIVSGAFKALGARETLGNLKNQLAQRDAAARAAENDRRRQLAIASLAQQGQAPESIPGPFSNEEFDRRSAPINPQAFLQAMGQHGAMPESVDVNMMEWLVKGQGEGMDINAVKPMEGTTTGGRAYLWGTGGQFQFVPTENTSQFEDRARLLDRKALYDTRRTILGTMNRPMLDADKAAMMSQLANIQRQIGGLTPPGEDEIKAATAYAEQLKEERLKAERVAGGGSGPSADDEAQAREALKLQPHRAAAIRALYKQRTGRELP